MNMPGIEFLRDRKGRRKAVLARPQVTAALGGSLRRLSSSLAAVSVVNRSLP